MGRQLLWRHTDRLFWRCFYGRFHHNGVANQGRFSMAVHRRCIYRSVLLRFRGRIEIYHSYGHTQTAVQKPVPHSCCAGVAAQTTPAQTVSWSIPISIVGWRGVYRYYKLCLFHIDLIKHAQNLVNVFSTIPHIDINPLKQLPLRLYLRDTKLLEMEFGSL